MYEFSCYLKTSRHNLEIETSRESSTLILSHVESTDGGMYTVTAVNVVGKCSWECSVDLKAKPAFTLPPNLKRQIAFQVWPLFVGLSLYP